jgi:hypothetical protein
MLDKAERFEGTNTLAYLSGESAGKKKVFDNETLFPGVGGNQPI